MSTIAAVVLNYKDWQLTSQCVSHLKSLPIVDDIVIVDNASPNDSAKHLKALEDNKRVHFIQSTENAGYASGNNLGAFFAYNTLGSQQILILNPDVTIGEEAIECMSDLMKKNPDYKLLTPVVEDSSGVLRAQSWDQYSYWTNLRALFGGLQRIFGTGVSHKKSDYQKGLNTVDCVSGACLFFDAQAFVDVGGFDERTFLYMEETIIGERLKRAGYKTAVVGGISYQHGHSVTINQNLSGIEEKIRIRHQSRDIFTYNYLNVTGWRKVLYKIARKLSYVDIKLIVFKHWIQKKIRH